MIFILITVFIDMLGIGIIIPILPELIREFVGGSSALAGRWYGVLAATYAVTQFVFAPLLGALSDRVGRRPVILISLFGLGIDYLIMGFAPAIGWLFVGRLIAGVMGANVTTANAYIADVSKPENRARNFGLIGVAFGLGFIFGPAIGGLLGSIDLRLPFFASAGLALLNWLYGFFVLPESLPAEKRDVFRWRKANPVGSLHVLRTYPLVAGLTAAFVFVILAQRGLETVWVLYTGHKFGWDERANGLSLALVGIMSAIVQGGLVQPVIKRIGERRAVLYGLIWAVVAFLGYGLATAGWMLLVVIVVGSISGVAGPAIQSLVAGSVPPEDQGKVQGGIQSLMSLTSIAAPLIFTAGLFSYFTSASAPVQLPGAPFLLGAVMYALAFWSVLRLFRRMPG
ncbi:MAG: TCR/Tet family MFS transporter [Gammaproteobacteria bacterium]|nr:TCR/Tet family MFS transporter [Gammaproteobacteria bacterium]MYF61746.1 TCR/Tet family MFS transporter [Gammaproteobacteria bacterium]MYI23373.1 TCR/Tet family MFS transporter [Gammaproteobacteria bacterium]